jgi:hypothetical protein
MSTDYYLICQNCDETTESMVASGSIAYGDKLWRGPEELKELGKFLFEHENHTLKFVSEHNQELEKILEIKNA